MPAASAKILYSSTRSTTSGRGTDTPGQRSFTQDELHDFILTCKEDGIPTTAFTARLYAIWRDSGLTHKVITDYIVPQTAMCPAPSLRYASAIAHRLIAEQKFTVEQAYDDSFRFHDMV